MRQILYKGFAPNLLGNSKIFLNGQKIKGEWVQGYYVACKEKYERDITHAIFTEECEHICMGEYKDWGWYEVIPETVCQFTSLYDERGMMIWENDIVRVRDNLGSMTAQVVWNETFANFPHRALRRS